MANKNIEVYWDTDSDPSNPGYVVRWDSGEQIGLTAQLDARDGESAILEAAEYLGVEQSMVTLAD